MKLYLKSRKFIPPLMELQEITRPLNAVEIKMLKKVRKVIEESKAFKYKTYHWIIAFLSGVAATCLAVYFKDGFLMFLFGTIAVFCFVAVVFGPYEIYKATRAANKTLEKMDDFLTANQVKVIPINALQIAIAEEFDDEGFLYIIEYKPGNILYLEEMVRKPISLQFEIYEEAFSDLTERRIHPLSEKIKPVKIPGKTKWAVLKERGWPAHLTTEVIGFDELMNEFRQQ